MTEERLERIRPCEHGEWNVHALEPGIVNEDGSLDRDKVCRGASRREITVDYINARDWLKHKHDVRVSLDGVVSIVDAALGDTGEDGS